LSKGMYFTKASASRWNLLSTRLGKNNIERDHSWKRLLRISPSTEAQWEKRQGYVKAVFDDANFDVNNIQDSLKLICNEALTNDSIEGWRKAFIKFPALFIMCHQGFIVKSANEIILLHESQRNHYHSEFYSKLLDLELKQKTEQLLPFKQLAYESVKSREDSPYVSLGQWSYKGNEYNIEIWFDFDEYKFLFYGEKSQADVDELIRILEGREFEMSEDYDEDYGTPYLYICKTQERVLAVLEDLCSDLRELVND
jgi:hypothetical protein